MDICQLLGNGLDAVDLDIKSISRKLEELRLNAAHAEKKAKESQKLEAAEHARQVEALSDQKIADVVAEFDRMKKSFMEDLQKKDTRIMILEKSLAERAEKQSEGTVKETLLERKVKDLLEEISMLRKISTSSTGSLDHDTLAREIENEIAILQKPLDSQKGIPNHQTEELTTELESNPITRFRYLMKQIKRQNVGNQAMLRNRCEELAGDNIRLKETIDRLRWDAKERESETAVLSRELGKHQQHIQTLQRRDYTR
ncbi:hypothetical protein ABW21_db0208656 [Orbilia brochopaga]|nr:hypothetical protein ABW21_db0208656 [Drechslerella brochopaga]